MSLPLKNFEFSGEAKYIFNGVGAAPNQEQSIIYT